MAKAKEETSIYNKGKRKEAIARIKMSVTKGAIMVNEKPISDYFPSEFAKLFYLKPFVILGLDPQDYTISIKVVGGGKAGQLESAGKSIAKALLDLNPDYRERLKKAGLLHRDPRVKERRKFGMAGKARKQKSSPKR